MKREPKSRPAARNKEATSWNESRAGIAWRTPPGRAFTWEHVAIELLMDIRTELKLLRSENNLGVGNAVSALHRLANETPPAIARAIGRRRSGKRRLKN